MKMRSIAPMKVAKAGYIVASAMLCLIGILFIAHPGASVKAIAYTLGAAILLFGCMRLMGYFSRDLFRLAFQYDLQLGILLIALGAIVLLKSQNVMNFIFITVGTAILVDGLFKVQTALDSKRFGIGGWWLILLFALLTGCAGLLLMLRPMESGRALIVLLGISLLAEGILNLYVAVSTVKIIRHQRPDIPEGTYREIK